MPLLPELVAAAARLSINRALLRSFARHALMPAVTRELRLPLTGVLLKSIRARGAGFRVRPTTKSAQFVQSLAWPAKAGTPYRGIRAFGQHALTSGVTMRMQHLGGFLIIRKCR